MPLIDESGALTRKRYHLSRDKATLAQWGMIEVAIAAFMAKYPLEWNTFVFDQKASKNTKSYHTAIDGDLKKSNWRQTASFPVVIRNGQVVDSLYPVLDKIIPGLTYRDSINFNTFLRKFPIFNPGQRIAASD